MSKLDDAYANAKHIPDGESYPGKWSTFASAYRATMGIISSLDLPYGPSPRQRYDFFVPDASPKGTVIFVHGGYWRAFDCKSWSHLAEGPRHNGWAVAIPSYDLVPEVTIAMITQQIAAAVTRIARETVGPLVLTGHSAGGHLVARMLAPGMLHEDIRARIRHVMPISPLGDLVPLMETSMNEGFGLDLPMAHAESPILQPQPKEPVTVWVGQDERPAFLEQAQAFSDDWNARVVFAKGRHHFDVIKDLSDPFSKLTRTLLDTPEPL